MHFKTLLSYAGASGEQTVFGKYFSVWAIRAFAPDKLSEVLKCTLRRRFPQLSRTLRSMYRDLQELIWDSLKSVYNTIIGTVSLLLSVLLWLYLLDTEVPLRLIVPIIVLVMVVLVAAIVTLLNAAFEANREANEERNKYETTQDEYNRYKARAGGLPAVFEGRSAPEGTQAALVCVLEPSQLFPITLWFPSMTLVDKTLKRLWE